MPAIASIASTTITIWFRDKVFYSLLLLGTLVILCSLFLNEMTVGEKSKIINDLGLMALLWFGVFMILFTISNTNQDKSLYMILTKPIPRFYWLIGHYIGNALILLANTLFLSLLLYGLVALTGDGWKAGMSAAIYLIYWELLIMVAVATFFSTFISSPALSKFCTLSVFIVGHISEEAKTIIEAGYNQTLKPLLTTLYYLLPNFSNFDLKTEAVHQLPIASTQLQFASLYGLCYVTLLLILSCWLFSKVEL